MASSTPLPFVPLYLAFGAGYLLSYLYRTVNAVISPELTRELALEPASLGFLTSAYFLAFATMQIPVGMMLDRYGPRRVEPVLLAIAAVGALSFALAEGLAGLTFARALIGVGVSACLMAPLKGFAVWYPPQRQASLSSWIMVAGSVGALAATTPLEYALRAVSWRTIFACLAGLTLSVAVWIWLRVPDVAAPRSAAGWREQWAGVARVFRHPRFWWIVPMSALGTGAFLAVQGLWAVPWMLAVEGRTRAEAAGVLALMGLVALGAYLFLGLFATALGRRGIRSRHMFATGFALNVVALAALVAGLPGSVVWWSLYSFGAAANILLFPVLNEGFPAELAGRANTGANLVMFVGSFALQWGIGVVAESASALAGADTPAGLRVAFLVVLVLETATLAWLALGWRRHAVLEPAHAH